MILSFTQTMNSLAWSRREMANNSHYVVFTFANFLANLHVYRISPNVSTTARKQAVFSSTVHWVLIRPDLLENIILIFNSPLINWMCVFSQMLQCSQFSTMHLNNNCWIQTITVIHFALIDDWSPSVPRYGVAAFYRHTSVDASPWLSASVRSLDGSVGCFRWWVPPTTVHWRRWCTVVEKEDRNWGALCSIDYTPHHHIHLYYRADITQLCT